MIYEFLNVLLVTQVKAKNQLRVNGLGYYMYFGSFYAVLLIQLAVLYVAILVISQVSEHFLIVLSSKANTDKNLFNRHLTYMP